MAVSMKFAGELPPFLVIGLIAWCASSGRASRNFTANTAPRPGAVLVKPVPRSTSLPSRHFSVEMVTVALASCWVAAGVSANARVVPVSAAPGVMSAPARATTAP